MKHKKLKLKDNRMELALLYCFLSFLSSISHKYKIMLVSMLLLHLLLHYFRRIYVPISIYGETHHKFSLIFRRFSMCVT